MTDGALQDGNIPQDCCVAGERHLGVASKEYGSLRIAQASNRSALVSLLEILCLGFSVYPAYVLTSGFA